MKATRMPQGLTTASYYTTESPARDNYCIEETTTDRFQWAVSYCVAEAVVATEYVKNFLPFQEQAPEHAADGKGCCVCWQGCYEIATSQIAFVSTSLGQVHEAHERQSQIADYMRVSSNTVA